MNDRTDDITEALTEGSTYEQFRLRHGMLFSSSIEAKTRYCLYLLWLSVAVGPILWLAPDAAAGERPALTLVALVGVGFVAAGFAGLSVVHRYVASRDVDPEQARSIVGLEELFSGAALITGGAGIVAAVALASLGAGGEPSYGGEFTPLRTAPQAVSGELVSAIGGAVALFATAWWLRVFGSGDSPAE